jgi:hypothetical protein
MRYLIMLLMLTALMLAGCQQDTSDEVEVEDDLSEVYDQTAEQAEQAEAEIAELLEGDPGDDRDGRAERVWQRAESLLEDALRQAEDAIEIAREEGGEAWDEARKAAERARDRAEVAWEEASAYTGETWDEVRESSRELYEQAESAWERLRDVEESEGNED